MASSSMMPKSVAAVLIATVLAGCGGSDRARTDARDAEIAVRAFSDALVHADEAALAAKTTPGYRLIEDGVFYDLPSTIASLRDAAAAGGVVTRNPDDFHVSIRGDVAWIDYRVTGTFTVKTERADFIRLETAVLERQDGVWRIAQMSSMLANTQK